MNLKFQGLVIVGITLVSWNSFAATSGSFLLSGAVNQILQIGIAPEAIASNLNLSVTEVDLKVATVNESSNSNTGYKIKISSLNNGKLIRSTGTEFVNYTVKYDGVSENGQSIPFTQRKLFYYFMNDRVKLPKTVHVTISKI